MLGGIIWVLAVILIWLVLFTATLTFTRYAAREHDREAMEAAISDVKEEALAAERVS